MHLQSGDERLKALNSFMHDLPKWSDKSCSKCCEFCKVYLNILECYVLKGNRAVSKEAVVQRCSIKKVFLEISQNSRENISARVSFLKSCRPEVFSCEFSENSKNTFFLTTVLVAASDSN